MRGATGDEEQQGCTAHGPPTLAPLVTKEQHQRHGQDDRDDDGVNHVILRGFCTHGAHSTPGTRLEPGLLICCRTAWIPHRRRSSTRATSRTSPTARR